MEIFFKILDKNQYNLLVDMFVNHLSAMNNSQDESSPSTSVVHVFLFLYHIH